MKKLFLKKLHTQKGFTLVEMLVAIFMFSVALSSLMLVTSKGLKAARQAQAQVRADYLALEALEVVRNIRDSAFIAGYGENEWTGVFNGLDVFSEDGCFTDGGSCNFYFEGDRMILQTCDDGCPVYYNETSNSYYQPKEGEGHSGTITPFTRTITFSSPGGPYEAFVTVTVAWNGGEVVYTQDLQLWL